MEKNLNQKPVTKIITISVIAVVLVAIIVVITIVKPWSNFGHGGNPSETSTDTDFTSPTDMKPLEDMAELYAQNPDVVGWIKIDGTRVDYPVMFTPDDEEKYLYNGFDGKRDINGVPFIDTDCSVDPESDNLIIYGHHMKAGNMFTDLFKYQSESFWKEHPTFTYKTMYEERTYEVIGAFADRVYYVTENVPFKFYQFINAETQEDFDKAINHYKSKTPYDMNVKAEFGDKFITLVTCAYHHEYGRYVVVGRDITNI